jgi:adenylate kinase
MEEHVNIILIGAQGSGKGTQAKKLSAALGVQHVASGDLFRQAAEEKTEEGARIKGILDRGELVPDDLTIKMVFARISEPNCVRDGFLLDGFPRTIPQARSLDEGLASNNRAVDCTVYLEVPRDVLLKRLSGRYICRAHQHVYNIETNPPKVAGICDIDGSELYQRSDDTGEAVQKRLDIFFNQTIKLLDYYRQQDKLIAVDGNKGIDEVASSLVSTIRKRVLGV